VAFISTQGVCAATETGAPLLFFASNFMTQKSEVVPTLELAGTRINPVGQKAVVPPVVDPPVVDPPVVVPPVVDPPVDDPPVDDPPVVDPPVVDPPVVDPPVVDPPVVDPPVVDPPVVDPPVVDPPVVVPPVVDPPVVVPPVRPRTGVFGSRDELFELSELLEHEVINEQSIKNRTSNLYCFKASSSIGILFIDIKATFEDFSVKSVLYKILIGFISIFNKKATRPVTVTHSRMPNLGVIYGSR
jgi:hypothetical protein